MNAVISRYKPQILGWFQKHDPSLASIMAVSRNLENQITGDLSFEELTLAVVKLLAKEGIIDKVQAKELRQFIKSFNLNIDSFSLKRKRHRSAPMIFSL